MFCSNRGAKLSGDAKSCDSFHNEIEKSPSVVVIKEDHGCLLKGCVLSLLALAFAIVAIITLICVAVDESEKDEERLKQECSAIKTNDAIKNGKELIALIRSRYILTDVEYDEAFENLTGKVVLFQGKVDEVGKTFVRLDVGLLDLFERILIEFRLNDSVFETVKTWHKGEVHTMRGRVRNKSCGIIDDAECDLTEIVD